MWECRVESEFTASLSRGTADGEWTSLCGATGNTLYREGADTPLPLPGQDMVAASANGGFSVALPLEMQLDQVRRCFRSLLTLRVASALF